MNYIVESRFISRDSGLNRNYFIFPQNRQMEKEF